MSQKKTNTCAYCGKEYPLGLRSYGSMYCNAICKQGSDNLKSKLKRVRIKYNQQEGI